MNKELLKSLGFTKEVEAVENNLCPLCKKQIDTSAFRDRTSRAEYAISGMCQSCQDKVFGV